MSVKGSSEDYRAGKGHFLPTIVVLLHIAYPIFSPIPSGEQDAYSCLCRAGVPPSCELCDL